MGLCPLEGRWLDMLNPMDLKGRHVIITGASSGIGAETAKVISKLGATVSLIARDVRKLDCVINELEGVGHAAYVADLNDPSQVEFAVQAAFDRSGAFGGAVYSAGVSETRPFKSVKPDKLLAVASVNYLSYVEFVRCVTDRKRRGSALSVVGVSSVNSEHGVGGEVAYCSSKAAMNGAMRAMARELAPVGIRVNNVLPGWVRTNMYDKTVAMLGNEAVGKVFDMLQYIGGPLEPIDVANSIAFLLSDAARGITGTEMVVGGGYLS